jgi:hypothetical protein
MKADQLASLVERPEVHRRILGAYTGPYSLGVAATPHGPAVVLKVADPTGFPTSVILDGEQIPVVVHGGFRAPVPL